MKRRSSSTISGSSMRPSPSTMEAATRETRSITPRRGVETPIEGHFGRVGASPGGYLHPVGRGRSQRGRIRHWSRRAPANGSRRRRWRRAQQIAVALHVASSDSASKLVKLRESETPGVFNDDDARFGDVDPDFNDHRRHEYVEFAGRNWPSLLLSPAPSSGV